MNTKTTDKAVLIIDKAMADLLKRRVINFRETAALKDCDGFIKGISSYCLYGIDHVRGQVVVLASEPTAADFNPYVTAKAKANAVSRYDQVVEYRDAGTAKSPKVVILCWTKSK